MGMIDSTNDEFSGKVAWNLYLENGLSSASDPLRRCYAARLAVRPYAHGPTSLSTWGQHARGSLHTRVDCVVIRIPFATSHQITVLH